MENISYNQAQAHHNLNTAHQAHQENTDSSCGICQYMSGAFLARDDSHGQAIRSLISQPAGTLEYTLIVKNS